MDAFLAGLEQAKANGHDISQIHSVASFFVSRVDTEIDKRLQAIDSPEAESLQRPSRDRERPPRIPGLPADLRRRPVGGAAGRGRQPAAPALGVHRRQRPRRTTTPATSSNSSPPASSTPPPRRPSTPSPTTASSAATPSKAPTPRPAPSSPPSKPSASTSTDVFAVLESEGVDKFEKSWEELLESVSERAREAQAGRLTPGIRRSHQLQTRAKSRPNGRNTDGDDRGTALGSAGRPIRSATPGTSDCRASPVHPGSSSSASPAISPARS